jgi:hypothetical protein
MASYLLVAVGLSIPFVFGTTIVFTTTSAEDAGLSNTLLNMAFLLVGAVLWYATVFVIPLAVIAFIFALPSG